MKVESEMTIRKNLEKQLETTHHKFVHHIDELQAEVETANTSVVTAKEQRAEDGDDLQQRMALLRAERALCHAPEEERAEMD